MSDTIKTLPVFQTVGDSIEYTLKNANLMIQLVWFWGLSIAVVLTGVFLGGGSKVLGLLFFGIKDPGLIWDTTNTLSAVAVLSLYVIASYSIVVGWHRGLLLDERPHSVHASIGKRELSYFLRTIAMFAAFAALITLFLVPMFVAAIGTVGQQTQLIQSLSIIGIIAGAAVSLLLSWRFMLVLPGSAVGDRRVSFGKSWSLTRANTWRLFGGFLLIALAQVLVSFVVFFVIGFFVGFSGNDWGQFSVPTLDSGVRFSHLAIRGLELIISMVGGFLMLSYMSYCYWFFVPPPGQDDLT